MGSARSDRRTDYRLVPVAAAAWLGVVAGLWGLPQWSCLVAAPALLLPWRRHIVVPFLAAALALLGGSAHLAAMQSDPAVSLRHRQFTRLEVKARSDPQCRPHVWGGCEWEMEADVASVGSEYSRARIVLQGEAMSTIERGSTVRLSGQLQKGFRDTIPSVGVLKVHDIDDVRSPSWPTSLSNQVRQQLSQQVEGLPAHARGLIPGMAVGDERGMSLDLREAMKRTSLIHLTAVSGAHLSIALAFLVLVIPGGLRIRVGVAITFAALLLLVVGPEPSVIRAVLMCWITSLAMLGRRRGQPLATLALVVIICSLTSPWITVQYGFALSVLATFGLLVTGVPLGSMWTASGMSGIAKKLAEAGAITIGAQLWSLPVLLTLDESIPLLSPLANVLVAPAVPVVTVLGMLAAATALPLPALAGFLCQLAVPFTAWISMVASALGGLPFARVPWFTGATGVVLAVALIGLVVAWQARKEKTHE